MMVEADPGELNKIDKLIQEFDIKDDPPANNSNTISPLRKNTITPIRISNDDHPLNSHDPETSLEISPSFIRSKNRSNTNNKNRLSLIKPVAVTDDLDFSNPNIMTSNGNSIIPTSHYDSNEFHSSHHNNLNNNNNNIPDQDKSYYMKSRNNSINHHCSATLDVLEANSNASMNHTPSKSFSTTSNSINDINSLLKTLASKELELMESRHRIDEIKKNLDFENNFYVQKLKELNELKNKVTKNLASPNSNNNNNTNVNTNNTVSSDSSSNPTNNNNSGVQLIPQRQRSSTNPPNRDKNNQTNEKQHPNSIGTPLRKKVTIQEPPETVLENNDTNSTHNKTDNNNNNSEADTDSTELNFGLPTNSEANYTTTKKINSLKRSQSVNTKRDSVWSRSFSMFYQFDQKMQKELQKSLNWEDGNSSRESSMTPDNIINQANDNNNNNSINGNNNNTNSNENVSSIWRIVSGVKSTLTKNPVSHINNQNNGFNSSNDSISNNLKPIDHMKKNKDSLHTTKNHKKTASTSFLNFNDNFTNEQNSIMNFDGKHEDEGKFTTLHHDIASSLSNDDSEIKPSLDSVRRRKKVIEMVDL